MLSRKIEDDIQKVILIGTSHSIQEGREKKDAFTAYLKSLCNLHGIQLIAEETKEPPETVGFEIANELSIGHKVIEPNLETYESLGIKEIHKIQYEILIKSGLNPYPEIENLPTVLFEEYESKMRIEHMEPREKVWLGKIQSSKISPVLVTCGANHFDSFAGLLSQNKIEVIKEDKKWGL